MKVVPLLTGVSRVRVARALRRASSAGARFARAAVEKAVGGKDVGVLAGQPIRLLSCVVPNAASAAADNDRTFGCNVEVWHERQMAEPEAAETDGSDVDV